MPRTLSDPLEVMTNWINGDNPVIEPVSRRNEMTFEDKIKFAVANSFNLLAEGKHGCGKSRTIIDCWEKLGYTSDIRADEKVYTYFNSPVIDVYEDIKGIPVNDNGKLIYIRPEHRVWDKVELVFFDEPNRAHIKVVNTLYELIQFRSINGVKLPNLKCVFAAMNPSGEDYTVEACDQSFYDRFNLHVRVDAILNKNFFLSVKGMDEKVYRIMAEWWKAIPSEIREKHASPRRIEYCIDIHNCGGNVADVIPATCNPERLQSILDQKEVSDMTFNVGVMDVDKWKTFVKNYSDEIYMPLLRDYVINVPVEILQSEFFYNRDAKFESNAKMAKFLLHVIKGCGGIDSAILTKFSACPDLLAQIVKTTTIDRSIRVEAHAKLQVAAPFLSNRLRVY